MEELGKLKKENERLKTEKIEAVNEKQQLGFKVVELESQLRNAQRSLDEKQLEVQRSWQEKNEAQSRQFLLQQELTSYTTKQFELLKQNNEQGFGLQRQLFENQRQMHEGRFTP